jgi:energy-coupling factor transporter transmembrane protein EcfT
VRQAGRLAVAMEARGFSSQLAMRGRTWAMPAPWLPSDSLLVALGAAVALVPVAATILLRTSA